MKNSKFNIFLAVLISAIFIVAFSGCSASISEQSDKLVIVTTIFPQYDFARQIAKDKAEVSILLAPGTESHTYEPTPLDMKKINDADIFIYTGENMEPWAQSIVESIGNEALLVVDASKGIELIEGDHDHGEEIDESEEEHSLDPHIWLDPQLAKVMTDNILQALISMDSDNSDFYTANAEKYKTQLDKLDSDIRQAVESAQKDTIVFGGRFAYAYFINRYDIKYISAYEGCSSHDEPSVQSIVNVVEFVKANDINVIYHEEFSDPKVAKSIAEQTGATLSVLNTVHNLSSDDMQEGLTYIDVMYQNLESLKKGLYK